MNQPSVKNRLEAAQQTIRFFETLLRASTDGIVITDASHNIIVGNEAFSSVFGGQWGDMIETGLFLWLEQLDTGALNEWISLEASVRAQGSCRNRQFRLTTPDSLVHYSVNASLLDQVADEEDVILSIWRDVTDSMEVRAMLKAQRELKEAELRYKTVADFTYDWEIWENPDGTLRYVSPSCERITGYPVNDFIHESALVNRIILPEDQEVWARHRNDIIEIPGPHEIQFRIRRRDGEISWIEHACRPVVDEQGEFLGYRSSNRDISRRKLAEKALEAHTRELAMLNRQAQEDAAAKALLLKEVNHRVKNNLAAITGILYIEKRHAEQSPDGRTHTAIIDDLVTRIKGLSTVHQMLSNTDWSPLPLTRLVRQMIDSAMLALSPDRRISVDVRSSAPVLLSPKDAHNIAIVINELTLNVIKHTAPSMETVKIIVRIAPEDDRETIWFEFRDDGPGFPAEVIGSKGRNVGMYLVENTVRHSMRGEIMLHNDNGAVVTIRWVQKQTQNAPPFSSR